MIPSEKWIWMMTGNYPKMRSELHTFCDPVLIVCKHCTRRLPHMEAVIVVVFFLQCR